MLKKIIIPALLLLTLVLALPAIADQGVLYASMFDGEGTEESPYMLSTPNDFVKLAVMVNMGNTQYNSAYYKLANSIDFSGEDFIPIGKVSVELVAETNSDGSVKTDSSGNTEYTETETAEYPFMGYLDGDGYTLRNITINSDAKLVGIFGLGKNAVVENLRVENIEINATRERMIMAGTLFGRYYGNSKKENVRITNCHIDGKLTARSDYKICLGGISGYHDVKNVSSVIENCRVDVKLDAVSKSVTYVGGLVGDVNTGAIIKNCVITGSAYSETTGNGNPYVGGIAARFFFDEWFGLASESSVLASDSVWYTDASNVINSVAVEAVGLYSEYRSNTFAHFTDATASNCFFDSANKVTSTINAHTGTEKSASELFDETFLTNTAKFDFENTWTMVLGKPELISKEPYIAYNLSGSTYEILPVGCDSCNIYAAFCNGSRPVAFRIAEYDGSSPATVSCEGITYDNVKLFALDDTLSPLCSSRQISVD